MVATAFSPRFILLYVFIVCAGFVHFRGRIRHRFMANTLVRASKAQNVEGEPVGILNRIFAYAYRVCLVGKWLKARSRFAYYCVKYALPGGFFHWIFLK